MERKPVTSSNLAEVGYDGGTLEVAFTNGSVYQYYGVPPQVYEGLMTAPSHGKYLDQFVKKPGYRFEKVA